MKYGWQPQKTPWSTDENTHILLYLSLSGICQCNKIKLNIKKITKICVQDTTKIDFKFKYINYKHIIVNNTSQSPESVLKNYIY